MNVTTTDPLELLIAEEERNEKEKVDEIIIIPCIVPVPSFLQKSFTDPLENLIALTDPDEALRLAIIN